MTALWSLPHGWRWVTTGDVAKVVGGSTPKTSEPAYWGGDIPWITPDDLSGFSDKHIDRGRRNITQAGYDSCSTQMVPAATVLFTSRAPIGYVAIAANPVCTNQGFKSFVCGPEISPDYLYWYLRSSTDVARSLASGTTFLELSARSAARIPVPLPPLNEQVEIVDVVEEHSTRLDHGLASLSRAAAKLSRLRASATAEALHGLSSRDRADIAATGNGDGPDLLRDVLLDRVNSWIAAGNPGRYRDPAPPSEGADAYLPNHWAVASLEQLTHPIRTISYGILMPKENVPAGIPYVRVRDIRNDQIDIAALRRTSAEIAANYRRSTLRAGDLLLAIRGSYGRLAEVPPELEGGNITQDTARIDVSPLISRRYIAAYLRGPVAQAYFKRVARGVAVKGVNIGDLRSMPVPLPPRSQQDAIAAEVERRASIANELEDEVRRASLRARALYGALLAGAFRGRLMRTNSEAVA
jgi:type I restriction enzyme, S subunit